MMHFKEGEEFVKMLTQVVIPLDENRAILSSKSMPPTPITSIWSAGLLSVLKQKNIPGETTQINDYFEKKKNRLVK